MTMRDGVYVYPERDRVVFGRPAVETVVGEIERHGAKRAFVIASNSLAQASGVLETLGARLRDRLAGSWTRIAAHTPRSDVVASAAAAAKADADLIITIGGGSVTDAGKMVRLCLANGIYEARGLDRLRTRISAEGKRDYPEFAGPDRSLIAVPSTLSAGEFTAFAGCTDAERQVKESFAHRKMAPDTVVLDPAVTRHTPDWLWLSTGIRAVDHAVEDLCSVNGTPLSDATSLHALRLLANGLRRSKEDAADLAARLDCQVGAWLSIVGSQSGVDKGASHGIGHVLGGTAGVPHGYTSCVMLPHVLRFNSAVNAERQAMVAEALGRKGDAAAAVIAELIGSLGLPRTLRDVGLARDRLDEIARLAMHDRWIHTNPRPIEGPAVVRELLEQAW
ncbi:MAG TPA: iron-containing alcohol dehydrogenase [Stellaceae bacterium]|nr:iron-containing alcohol dehydrogenase [Stellaceae bacterium]